MFLRRALAPLLAALALVALIAPPGAAQEAPTTDRQLRDRVLVLAHRGSSKDAPEHTFEANDEAVADDADFLECDLQITEDGVLVCIHDTTVDRTSDGTGNVSDFTLAELRRLDWGSWFSPQFAGADVMPFEEQLRCYRALNPRLRFHIETKQTTGEPGAAAQKGRLEGELVRLLNKYELLNPDPATSPVIVQSFDPASLVQVNDLTQDRVPTALLSAGPGPLSPPPQVDIVAPSATFLRQDPAYVDALHAQGVEVHTYTVDDPAAMEDLIRAGVDGIFTNRPDVLRALLLEKFPSLSVPAAERGNPARGSFALGCPGVAGTVRAAGAPDPVVPEVPSAALLPAAGVLAAGLVLARRRRASAPA